MMKNNKKKQMTKQFLIMHEKRKKKNEDYNGIIYYNHNLNFIFKYCKVYTAVKLFLNG